MMLCDNRDRLVYAQASVGCGPHEFGNRGIAAEPDGLTAIPRTTT
jgi:hypothetical protein